MKGYYPVEIPTKKYIRAYILSRLGPQPMMNSDSEIGAKLYDVIQHQTNRYQKRLTNKRYDCTIRVYVSYQTFRQRGAYLNETNIANFNLFVERQIKFQMRVYFDLFVEILPSFTAHLPDVRRRLGIDLDDWSDDSIQKDYYRYRLRSGKKTLYSKNTTRSLQSGQLEKPENIPF